MKFTERILNSCAKNTNAGLANHGELNIDVMKQDARPKLGKWFGDRWCIDIPDTV
jgi:hypothetical protein